MATSPRPQSQHKLEVKHAPQLTWVELPMEQTRLMVPDVASTEETVQLPSSEVNDFWAYLIQVLKSNQRVKGISSLQG